MSGRVWAPPCPSWIDTFAPRSCNASTSRDKPGINPAIIDAKLEIAVAACLLWRCHFHRNQAGPALGPRAKIGNGIVAHETIGVRSPRRHRRHDHTILDLDAADPPRSK